jgi:hypothetical protein
MAGMEALGRLCNVVNINISTNAIFKQRGASCTMVVLYGAAAVVTLAQDISYGGAFATALACIKNIYWRATPGDGTVVWNKLAYVNGTAPFGSGPLSTYTHGTTTGLTTAYLSVFHIFTSEMSDPYDYIKVTITGSGNASIFPVDLVHQRAPANLEIISS